MTRLAAIACTASGVMRVSGSRYSGLGVSSRSAFVWTSVWLGSRAMFDRAVRALVAATTFGAGGPPGANGELFLPAQARKQRAGRWRGAGRGRPVGRLLTGVLASKG